MDVIRIKARIAELAETPKNVRFEDVQALLENHIRHLFEKYDYRSRGSHHVFTLSDPRRGTTTLTIKRPSTGCLKKVYVRKFVDAMEELGLYDPEE
jgi:hypothetical protein